MCRAGQKEALVMMVLDRNNNNVVSTGAWGGILIYKMSGYQRNLR